MENNTEKKWFVFVKDHHEGPHSLLEIQDKLDEGKVPSEGYVWTEGMSDWQRMTDVADFRPLLRSKSLGRSSEPGFKQKKDSVEQVPLLVSETSPVAATAEKGEELGLLGLSEAHRDVKARNLPTLLLQGALVFGIAAGSYAIYRQGYLDPVLNSTGLRSLTERIAGWGRPYVLRTTENVPWLQSWISPIPRLDEVAPEEYQELQKAAGANLKKFGPQFALALSKEQPSLPTFYVASNLTDGARFRIWLVGVPETLLNQLSFAAEFGGVLNQRLAQVNEIKFADGRMIPRGEYRVYLTADETQSPSLVSLLQSPTQNVVVQSPEGNKSLKVLTSKTYFLGGNKDKAYYDRLKDFHDKLRARAASEIIEVKQFMLTLYSQLDATQDKFRALGKPKPSPLQRKLWQTFHKEWTDLQSELDQIFQKWTPEVVKNDYFYGTLYSQLLDLGRSVSKIHDLQQGYFNGIHSLKGLTPQLQAESKTASELFETLKAKLEKAEKLPPSPSGMPMRENL